MTIGLRHAAVKSLVIPPSAAIVSEEPIRKTFADRGTDTFSLRTPQNEPVPDGFREKHLDGGTCEMIPIRALLCALLIWGAVAHADEHKSEPSYLRFVVKDAGAGGYEAFPDVCRLDDGRLICVYYAGYGHTSLPNEKYSRGGRVSCCFSFDEGRTWSDPQVLYDGPHDDRDPSVVQLADGTILCNFFTLSRSKQPGKSWEFDGSFVVTSKDQGETWSAPRMINREHACSSPVRVLKNGELILGLYGERDGVAYGGVVRSSDQGKTWSPMTRMDNNGAYLDAETDIIQLNDGTLYAALRGGKGAQMHQSRSRDNGQTWTVCEPIGFHGHCPYFHRTNDGTILLAHRIPATSLHYSSDECRSWSDNLQIDSSAGAYPSMVNLEDGSVLTVFYEEGSQSNIRARRFEATKQGIQWLGFEQPGDR